VDANNDVWVGGFKPTQLECEGFVKVTGAVPQQDPSTYFNLGTGGYGAIVDGYNVLWSAHEGAARLMRYTGPGCTSQVCCPTGPDFGDYGLAIDPQTLEVWHTDHDQGTTTRLNEGAVFIAKYNQGNMNAQGAVVDNNHNVWIAHSKGDPYYDRDPSRTVGHLRTDGTWVGNVQLSIGLNDTPGPTGVAVDSNGKIWVSNWSSNTAMRIDPNSGPIGKDGYRIGAADLTVDLGQGASPYNYSDMTGFVLLGVTTRSGVWDFIQDGGLVRNWNKVSWTADVPAGTSLTVQVRTANTLAGLPGTAGAINTFMTVPNYRYGQGQSFTALNGRYLEVRVRLSKDWGAAQTPVLRDLTVHAPN
jgi:hypothetical protein